MTRLNRPSEDSKASGNDLPLIPRSVLFGNPDKDSPRLSPDGSKLAFLAPVQGVQNVWVGPAGAKLTFVLVRLPADIVEQVLSLLQTSRTSSKGALSGPSQVILPLGNRSSRLRMCSPI